MVFTPSVRYTTSQECLSKYARECLLPYPPPPLFPVPSPPFPVSSTSSRAPSPALPCPVVVAGREWWGGRRGGGGGSAGWLPRPLLAVRDM